MKNIILDLINAPYFKPYLLGILTMVGLIIAWRVSVHLYYRIHSRIYSKNLYRDRPDDEKYSQAIEITKTCKQRLRYQKKLSPRWIEPLITEVPDLIKDIAEIYYPESEDPLFEPDMSQFARAVQLAAKDVADYLEHSWFGRRLDFSGKAIHKITTASRKLRKNRWLRGAYKVYDKIRPAWQLIRYKSPFMWAGMLAHNAGVRFAQPKIIDIVARRSIELYSGELAYSRIDQEASAAVASGEVVDALARGE